MIKVMVTGFLGRIGSQAARMVAENKDFELVALVNHNLEKHEDELSDWKALAPIYESIEEGIQATHPDAAVDFTSHEAAYTNTRAYIENNVHPVIGTSGFSEEQIQDLEKLASEKELGGVIAPNFAIGSVLMQKFAGEAAKYFPDVEIIEMHHADKKDAPSGTAQRTAEIIYEARGDHESGRPDATESMPGARGADYHGVHIHSVRLPGLNSHQIVQFGGTGESLSIRQDSFDNSSYMSGVEFGIKKAMELTELIYGLEKLL